MRLILENSTVCLISRRISLLCPVDVNVCSSGLLGWVGVGVAVSLTMILARPFLLWEGGLKNASFVQSWMWLLLIVLLVCCFGGGLVGMFSMESLILAQDERWRRA